MVNCCVICGGTEEDGEVLLQAPCERHYVCVDDVKSFFERAIENESLYPPKCCDQVFILDEWEAHMPFEVYWKYQEKEQGEYSIFAKSRVYCGNTLCHSFLHPDIHTVDPNTNITYAVCQADDCGSTTCISCKNLLTHGPHDHRCEVSEDEKKFKQTAQEKGYQECFVCGRTVELAEACNHITCECGNNFCYICGKDWLGLHGCPQYGSAEYDEEGYNQDGYHKDTGLNRDGRTRRQQMQHDRGEDDDDNEGEEDPDEDVLRHVTDDRRAIINALPPDFREEALDALRIVLFETQGITFNQGGVNDQGDGEHGGDEGSSDREDGDSEEDEVEDEVEEEEEKEESEDDDDHEFLNDDVGEGNRFVDGKSSHSLGELEDDEQEDHMDFSDDASDVFPLSNSNNNNSSYSDAESNGVQPVSPSTNYNELVDLSGEAYHVIDMTGPKDKVSGVGELVKGSTSELVEGLEL